MNAGWLAAGAAILTCGAVLAAGPNAQDRQRNRDRSRTWDNGRDYSFNIQNNRDGQPVTSCGDLDVTIKRGELARDEEVQNIVPTAQALSISGAQNGPVFVTGEDRSDYQVSLCKFTAADTADEARQKLANLSLQVANGRVTVNGPQENGYLAYLIVQAPRQSNMNVNVTNGPLDLRSLSGHIVARTLNGPLAVRGVTGDVDVQATNGPVSVREGGGNMRVTSQNGPLSLALTGTDWQGTGLDARAQNGPLSLSVPEDYRSGVLVNISPNSPFACGSAVCRNAQRSWDEQSRTLKLGSDPNPIIHVSAVNGPVSIGSKGQED